MIGTPNFCFSQRAGCVLLAFGRYGWRVAYRPMIKVTPISTGKAWMKSA
jgi:hypothetical protein